MVSEASDVLSEISDVASEVSFVTSETSEMEFLVSFISIEKG